jgi:hypothetical protein
MKLCDYDCRMETTETATCRYCGKAITREVPAPFKVLVEGAKPTDWADADGGATCTVPGGERVAHAPEHLVNL